MHQPMGPWHHWMDQPFFIPLLSLTIAAPSFPFLELGFICSHLMIICVSISCPIFVFFNGLEIHYDFAVILDSSFMQILSTTDNYTGYCAIKYDVPLI